VSAERKTPRRVLDLFCGAGGAAMGLHRAWPDAEIVGVDIKPQPRYPFTFVQGDVMSYDLTHANFDFVWASPPCEHYSQCTPKAYRGNHADLIGPTRERLLDYGVPFVIENVPSARRELRDPIMLCGSMFSLQIRRHRFFELRGIPAGDIPLCAHIRSPVLITGTHRRTYEPRYEYTAEQCREASGLTWMTRKEMDKAIPPAYSEYIARQFTKGQP
jgi:DNA (cytosine-5)-methyltransferase 1